MKRILTSRNWLAVWTAGLLCAAALAPAALRSQTMTFAGVQTTLASSFSAPAGVAVDASGNVYVADSNGGDVSEILAVNGKIPPNPTIVQLGGGFGAPNSVAVDANGNVFVADTPKNAVDEIPAGCVSASCVVNLGPGFRNPTAVAVDANGDVFVADSGNNSIKEIMAVGGSVPAKHPSIERLSGIFSAPQGVAVDANGDVYVADTNNHAIREIVAVGGAIPANGPTILTVASGLQYPSSVAVDALGDVFVSGSASGTVQEIEAVNGSIPANNPTIVSLGAGWGQAAGLATDAKGNLFVADSGNSDVMEVSPQSPDFGTANTCPSGSGSPSPCSQMLTLNYFVTAGGTLGVTRVFTEGAQNQDFTLSAYGCISSVEAGENCWVNVTFTPSLTGIRTGAVQIADATGNVLATTNIHGIGVGPQIAYAQGALNTLASIIPGVWGWNGDGYSFGNVAVDESGDVFLASQTQNTVLEILAVNGRIPTANPTILTLSNSFNQPRGVAVDGSGNVFVTDALNGAVKEIVAVNGSIPAANPVILTIASGFQQPTGIAVDGSGNLFFTDAKSGAVNEIMAVNGSIPAVNPTIRTLATFTQPWAIAVDASGNVFVTDLGTPLPNGYQASPVYKILAVNGLIPTVNPTIQMLNAGFQFPQGIAVDAAGDLWIADTVNQAVKKFLAVNGSVSMESPVKEMYLHNLTQPVIPSGLALDGKGNVILLDSFLGTVDELNLADLPALKFDATAYGGTGANSVTIESIGNAPLDLTGLRVTGQFYPIDGSGAPSDCFAGSSIAAGSSCNVSIGFNAEAIGPGFGSLALTDNALNSNPATQTIKLNGNGYFPSGITYGAPPFTLAAVDFAGAPFTYSVTGPAKLSGNTLAVTGAGQVTLKAVAAPVPPNQAGETDTRAFTVSPAPLTVAANSESLTYGYPIPTLFTGQVTGAVNGDTLLESFTTTATEAVGAYPIVPSVTGDTGNYNIKIENGTLTVLHATTRVQVTPSSTSAATGQSVTFTVQVLSNAGPLAYPPTGTIVLNLDASGAGIATTLNANGAATFTTTLGAPGSHQVAVVYEGDTNYTSSTSPTLTEVVTN